MAQWWKSKGESPPSVFSGNTHSLLSSSPWFGACVRPGGADVMGEGSSVTATYWICACHTTLWVMAGPGQQVTMNAAMAAYNTCSFQKKAEEWQVYGCVRCALMWKGHSHVHVCVYVVCVRAWERESESDKPSVVRSLGVNCCCRWKARCHHNIYKRIENQNK